MPVLAPPSTRSRSLRRRSDKSVRDIAVGVTTASLAALLVVSVAAAAPFPHARSLGYPGRPTVSLWRACAFLGPRRLGRARDGRRRHRSARARSPSSCRHRPRRSWLAERGRVRTLFRVAPPPGPPAAASPEYDTTVAQRSTALAASPSHMAFVRAVTPPSGATLPTGRAPLRGALGGDAPLLAAVARPAQPRLRALAGGRPPSPGAPCVRARPTDVDGSGARVVYSELVEDCGPAARRSTRIVALEPAARGYRSRVLARSARSRLPSGFDLDGST